MNQAGLDLFAALNVHTCPRISNYYILGGSYLNQENVSKDFIFTLPSDYNMLLAILGYVTKYQLWYYTPTQGVSSFTESNYKSYSPSPTPFIVGEESLLGAKLYSTQTNQY